MSRIKDPIQPDLNAYEILELPTDTPFSRIDEAFKNALQTGKHPVQEIKNAHLTLKNPINKALTDVMLYDENTINDLEKSDNVDFSIFNGDKRFHTIQNWEQQFTDNLARRNSLDLEIAHAMAVFWLNWFLFEQKNLHNKISLLQKSEQGSVDIPVYEFEHFYQNEFPLFTMGKNLIKYWVLLFNNPQYYQEIVDLKRENDLRVFTDQVTIMIHSFFKDGKKLLKMIDPEHELRFRDAPLPVRSIEQLYFDLEVEFDAELETAKILKMYGLQSKYFGNLGRFGGRLMMELLEVSDEIIENILNRSYKDLRVLLLLDAFGPHFELYYLAFMNRYSKGFKKIDFLKSKGAIPDSSAKAIGAFYWSFIRSELQNNQVPSAVEKAVELKKLIANNTDVDFIKDADDLVQSLISKNRDACVSFIKDLSAETGDQELLKLV